MGKQRSRWTSTLALAAATALSALTLNACELPATCAVNWDGPAAGDFADAANWDTGSVPTPAQHACAAAGTSITVSTPVESGSFNSLGTVTVSSAGHLTATGNTIVDTLVVRGTVAGGGAIVATRADLRTGTVDGSSTVVVLGPSTSVDGATITGARTLVLNGLDWKGTVRLCATGALALRGTVRVVEPAAVSTVGCPGPGTPTFIVEPKATLDLGSTLSTDVPLRNQGTVQGAGTIAGAVTNAGTISPGAATPVGSFTNFTGRIQIDGAYSAEAGALLIMDVNGVTPGTEHDQLVLGADATLSSTGLIIRHGIAFNPVLPSSYHAVVVTGGHALTGGPPTPFTAYGGYATWSRSITGGNTLTLTVASCPPGPNFAGLDLTDADLRACTFTGADFTGANLTGANLTGARFNGATFTGATVERARLGFTSPFLFSPGIRSGGLIGTPAALPSGTVLTKGYLVGSDANLVGADLSGATIIGANITLADFTGATLTGVTSSGITFGEEICERIFCVSIRPTFSPGTAVHKGHLVGPGVDLTGVDLTGTNLAGLDLSNVRIGGADLLASTGPGNASTAALVYDPAAPTRCSDGTSTGSAGVTSCTGRGPGW